MFKVAQHTIQAIVAIQAAMLSSVSFAAPPASSLQDINICYVHYREEMTTAALYTADKKGYFEQNGIKVHWVKKFKGKYRADLADHFTEKQKIPSFRRELFLVDRLDAGECDVGSMSFESIAGRGLPDLNNIVPLATYRYGKDYDTHLAQRIDLDLKSISDLKGKRIRASSIGVFIVLGEILKAAHLKMSDVNISWVDVHSLPKAFDNKEADLVLAYVPTVPLLIASNRVKIFEKDVYSRYLNGLVIPHSMLVGNRGFISKKAALFQKFLAAFKRGAEDLKTHPENVVFGGDIIEYPTKTYSKADAEESLNYFKVQMPLIYDTPEKNFFQESQFAEYQDKMVAEGFLSKASDLSAWKN
jgi:ABC-type nitrate/sulfonate/bicarbonate transport system substrate-binding protein